MRENIPSPPSQPRQRACRQHERQKPAHAKREIDQIKHDNLLWCLQDNYRDVRRQDAIRQIRRTRKETVKK